MRGRLETREQAIWELSVNVRFAAKVRAGAGVFRWSINPSTGSC